MWERINPTQLVTEGSWKILTNIINLDPLACIYMQTNVFIQLYLIWTQLFLLQAPFNTLEFDIIGDEAAPN